VTDARTRPDTDPTAAGVVRTTPEALAELRAVTSRIASAMESVIEGKPAVVRTAITVLLAGGHLLIEDVPGVGKTMLAKALARSIDCSVRRIQFTPDLLPSDITGVSVFNQDLRDFEFRPGAIFANVVVGDEINRASPKTQSALLECMEEAQVTVDGTTYCAPSAVHGHGHPEPHRDGGDLPAARGAARPVHGAHLNGPTTYSGWPRPFSATDSCCRARPRWPTGARRRCSPRSSGRPPVPIGRR
jgi:hypothetical protein